MVSTFLIIFLLIQIKFYEPQLKGASKANISILFENIY